MKVLESIAAYYLFGESVPKDDPLREIAIDTAQYDEESDEYQPLGDTEALELREVVEMARKALPREKVIRAATIRLLKASINNDGSLDSFSNVFEAEQELAELLGDEFND